MHVRRSSGSVYYICGLKVLDALYFLSARKIHALRFILNRRAKAVAEARDKSIRDAQEEKAMAKIKMLAERVEGRRKVAQPTGYGPVAALCCCKLAHARSGVVLAPHARYNSHKKYICYPG